ncbi:MAG: thiamine pyrophosphate-dependent dehydrogenase E1 component subunit alpha [Propionibacteriales bacterium]|nr:thiamine pyrophosphate-dependent dehydrogenase E1 component subunit alpha [Propionibacteriales bacterium]
MEPLNSSRHIGWLDRMVMMRRFEQEVAARCVSGEIHGEMHLGIGQEAVAAVLADHLIPEDALVSTHRPHLHALACGVDPIALLAELLERDGLNRGKGGHMHLFDATHRFMCTGIVGASAPLALGYALAQKHRQECGITVAVAGDAAVNQGAVFESMNLAAVLGLRVLFLVENNEYGISVPRSASTAGDIHRRGEAMGIPGLRCDGRDVDELDAAFAASMTVVRDEGRPALLVADVDRWRGHYEGDADLYRSEEQKAAAMGPERDPVHRLSAQLEASGSLNSDGRAELERRADAQVLSWASAANERPLPARQSAIEGVFVDD